MSKDASGTSSYERAFRYYYDALNRDTAAIYAERTAASTSAFTTTNGWNENRITYDQNGNILTLFRDSTSQGSGGHTPIDNLTYTYDTNNPNQLQKVTDGTGAQYTNSGFRNRTGSTSSYTYDGNGNLTNEPYKGFSSIAYDVLNRTDKITFTVSANRYIDYTYDASGNLIRKRQYDNVGGVATLQNTTDYIDGFVYTTVASTQTLQYFAMPEGRVLNTSGTLSQEYSITDQQGNVRITFDNTGAGGVAKVRQENSYYAFGLIMPGSTVTTPTNPNKHLYNGGSEWQNDFGNLPDYYQTFNRNYDAALGRWIGVDPAAESAESMTSYQYAGNNPVMYNDPLGDLLSPPGAHLAPYIPWQPLYQDFGVAGQEAANEENFAGGSGGGGAGDLTGLTGYLDMTGTGPDVTANINYENGTVTGNGLTPSQQFAISNSIQNGDLPDLTANNGGFQIKYRVDSYGGSVSTGAKIISTAHTINVDFDGNEANQGDPYSYAGNLFHVPVNNLPPNDGSIRQIAQTCVFCTIAAGLNYRGKQIDGATVLDRFKINGKVINDYQETMILNGGLPNSLLGSAYDQYFIGSFESTWSGYMSLMLGNPLLGTYKVSQQMSHDVFVTGVSYFSSGPNAGYNFAFWNPATGFYGVAPMTAFYHLYSVTMAK